MNKNFFQLVWRWKKERIRQCVFTHSYISMSPIKLKILCTFQTHYFLQWARNMANSRCSVYIQWLDFKLTICKILPSCFYTVNMLKITDFLAYFSQDLFPMSISLLYDWLYQFSSVQSLSRVLLFETSWIIAHQTSLSITNSWDLLKLMSIEPLMPSSHFILCCPLLLLPPTPPRIRAFSNKSILRMRWPKYWSFNFSISPSNKHPGLIFLRNDWLDLLEVQGTLKSLLQKHSSKASVLQHSAFFTVQLSHHTWPLERPYLWLDRLLFAK